MGFGEAGQGQHAWTLDEARSREIVRRGLDHGRERRAADRRREVSVECEVDGNHELERFYHFNCRILATYADETVLNEKGRIDYHTFKPALFELPTYEYFVTGDKVGDCERRNSE